MHKDIPKRGRKEARDSTRRKRGGPRWATEQKTDGASREPGSRPARSTQGTLLRGPPWPSIVLRVKCGCGVKIRAAAVALELEFFTMRGHRRHDGLCRFLSALERGGSQNAAHDHARVHVPGLRLQTDPD